MYDAKAIDGSSSPGTQIKAFADNPGMQMIPDFDLLIINEYRLDQVTEKKVFDSLAGRYRDDIPPEVAEEYVKNSRAMNKYAAQMGKPLAEMLAVVPRKRFVEKFITFCPTLSLSQSLAQGDYPIQMNGYHILPITCDLLNGKPNTPTDQLSDPQRMVNKRMSTETYILATSFTNGVGAEVSMFATPEEFQRWKTTGHQPGFRFELAEGASMAEKKFVEMPRGNVSNEYLSSTKSILDMLEMINPAVPATQGLSDAGESGVAFQKKLSQALITMVVPKIFIREAFQKLYQMYLYGARHLYDYPIILPCTQSDDLLKLNYGTPDSIEMSDIGDMEINISESPTSSTKRGLLVQEAASALAYMDQDSPQKKIVSGIIGKNLPQLNESDRKAISDAVDLEQKNVMLQAELNGLELQIKIKAAKAQLSGQGGDSQADPLKIGFTFKGEDAANPDVLALIVANGGKAPAKASPAESSPQGGPSAPPPMAPGSPAGGPAQPVSSGG
jgi:hypothetical protein